MPEDWQRIASTRRSIPLPRYHAIVRDAYWDLFNAGALTIDIKVLRNVVILEGHFPDYKEVNKVEIVPLSARERYPWNLPSW